MDILIVPLIIVLDWFLHHASRSPVPHRLERLHSER